MRLVVVVPRYGPMVLGGAEAQMRDYAEGLAARGHEVRVLTTCAVDHHSWANELAEGRSWETGVEVRRFPVTRPRDHHLAFRQARVLDAGLLLGRAGEIAWLRNAGHSDALLAALELEEGFDAALFAPYLFSTTVFGAAVHPRRSIVVPCLHDEIYARFKATQDTLRSVRGLIFNTDAERELAHSLLERMPSSRVVGEGFTIAPHQPAAPASPHAVAYAGRRESGKRYDVLLDYLALYNDGLSRVGPVRLLLMGSGPLEPRDGLREHVVDLGFVDEARKRTAMRDAVATVQLSRNESFCRVLMESWLSGTPVVVDADCAVTRAHCESSGGGVWVRDAAEFAAALDMLRSDDALRRRLAGAGQTYVADRYSHDAVLDRMERAIAELLA